MPKTKTRKRRASRRPSELAALQRRVSALEGDVTSLRTDMGTLADEVAGLNTVVKQVDARSQRGERLMNEMQLEQRRASRMIDAIATKFQVAVEPPVVPPADPGDAAPPDADEPE